MAIVKHIASKNSSYAAAIDYLKYEHDEKGKLVLDESGRKIERENFQMVGLNCNPDTWVIECMEANRKYNVNHERADIKRHEYVISYDPKDNITTDQALQNGIEFAKQHFPGHQTIIAVHQDGTHKSGNVHVHIDINSVRIMEQEQKPYMNRRSDYAEGMKHRCSSSFMYHAKEYVMEQCREQGLLQKELNKPSHSKVSNQEYWSQRRGQEKENQQAMTEGRIPTTFDTDLEEIRQAIKVSSARNRLPDGKLDDISYQKDMNESFGIQVTESRGRLSYMHPKWIEEGTRTKPVSDRKLGAEYERRNLENGIDRQQDWEISKGTNSRKHSKASELAQDIIDNTKSRLQRNGQDISRSHAEPNGRKRNQTSIGSYHQTPGRVSEEIRRTDEEVSRHGIQGRERYRELRQELTNQLPGVRRELQQNSKKLRDLKSRREEIVRNLSENHERQNNLNTSIQRETRYQHQGRSHGMEI